MEQLLDIREEIKYIFRKNGKIITLGTKFILNFSMYLWILSFGMYDGIFAVFFEGSTQFIYLAILCILGVILPLPYVYSLFAINIFMQLSTHLFFALFLLLIMFAIILLYGRIAVEESVLILITSLGLALNIPFVAPLIAGLYFGVTAFIPLVLGSILYYFIDCFQQFLILVQATEEMQIIGLEQALNTYKFISEYFASNGNLISTLIILVGGFVVVKVIQKLNMDFYKYVAIAFSFIYYIVAFMLMKIIFSYEYGLLAFIIGAVLSIIVAGIIVFFDTMLDYKSTKYVKFEDEKNLYYVKVVPKLYED